MTRPALVSCMWLLALSLSPLAGPAHAETYDTCAGFIESVPTTITTQGVWCLRKDLSTNITSGAAITIATNNVTLDCNQFKLGGLAAGPSSLAKGVHAVNRLNVTVRNCGIRGFHRGIDLDGGASHKIEHNRLDHNLHIGIRSSSERGIVQYNEVYDTGGALAQVSIISMTSTHNCAAAIAANGDVIGNVVDGMTGPAETSDYTLFGLVVGRPSPVIRDNRVRRLTSNASTGNVVGIIATSSYIRDNLVAGVSGPGQVGISVQNTPATCVGNVVYGYATPLSANCPQP